MFNLERMLGQLALLVHNIAMIVEEEEEKFLSQLVLNPQGVHEVRSSSNKQQEEAKSITTLRRRKLFEKKSGGSNMWDI